MSAVDFTLTRNAFGALVFVRGNERHEGVVPVRAFPIAAPEEGIGLVSTEGHELLWIEQLNDLPAELRALVSEELASREFMPIILRLLSVSTFATPSTWQVETDRGETSFILRGEEGIRRLAQGALLISDSHGIQFLIPDLAALDRNSRRFLDRFL